MAPTLIALEEHFDSHILTGKDALHANLPGSLASRLTDVADLRITEMDKGNISRQVVSHIGLMPTPPELCTKVNDCLATACLEHPDRLSGFATLPMQDPVAAAAELDRCVRQHKFLGALINSHLEDGSSYDSEKYWVVFAKAVELDVPVYIHPNYPAEQQEMTFRGAYPPIAGVMLGTASWGWHADCGLQILRLYAAGLFDKFPNLKIIIGHMGEMIPYMLERIIHTSRTWGKFDRNLRTVWTENIWVTTSGMFTLPPLRCLLEVTPKGHVMYSLDYPFSDTEQGKAFVEEIGRSGLLTEEEFEGFCHGNAERLLKIESCK